MRKFYLLRFLVILTTSLVASGCTYMVAESLDNCRVESEKFLGYTLWEEMDCTDDKDEDNGPLVRKLKRKPDGDTAH